MPHIETDILIVGAGGAGMYAAVAAARGGARVLLADKSLVGRGGATVMAQMTVAAAVGEEEPDDWTHHFADTLAAGRGLCNEPLAAALCADAPARIREMDGWKVGWARGDDGHMCQVTAPGHDRKRCVYVDFLNTGPAVAKTLRAQVARAERVTRASGLAILDLVRRAGRITGAVGVAVETGEPVTIAAGAVILAAGGLTRLYARNSASTNLTGDSYALALRAGATLIDMEFPQFFPIGHLAPRLVGMDPIMWDPFRYKLGGRLLNGKMEDFIERYGDRDSGTYTAMRDITSYAIVKELAAGRGSPAGGVYLSFEHISATGLRDAFGPVIDRLATNGIDLTERPVEVAPIAHYHMGGIRVTPDMETDVPRLFAAGEAVGGANGANRLSGNAITEAFVFGERAGRHAAKAAIGHASSWDSADAEWILDELADLKARARPLDGPPTSDIGRLWRKLQDLMWRHVGLLRTGDGLAAGLARIREMRTVDLPGLRPAAVTAFNMDLLDWYDLRAALVTAEAVAAAALNRRESRGAHQREDAPDQDPAMAKNQAATLAGDAVQLTWADVVRHVPPSAVAS